MFQVRTVVVLRQLFFCCVSVFEWEYTEGFFLFVPFSLADEAVVSGAGGASHPDGLLQTVRQ